jgi:hypothetical protein
MTARLQPLALLDSGEIETPFVDGFTVVSADDAERDRLTQLWQSEHGEAVAFIAASDLPKQPEERAALASDVLRRELAIAEAQEALVAAERKHNEALDGVGRREDAATKALAALSTPAEEPKVDTTGLEGKVEQLANAVIKGADVLARLQDEVAFDAANRHPLQSKITRVPVGDFETRVAKRRSILSDAANVGLIDSGAAANLGRVLSSLTPDKATDPMALELFTRGTDIAELKAEWAKHPLDAEVGALDRQLGMARAEVTRLEQTDSESSGGSSLSIIEQALHIVLDEQSDEAPDGQRQAARALKREMLDGPGPLMDMSGWSTKPTAVSNARLDQARHALERLENERATLMSKHEAKHGIDPTPQVLAFEAEVVSYLGEFVEADVLRTLSETRILPSFPPALEVSLRTGIQRCEAQGAAVKKELEAIEAARTSAPPKSLGSRTEAMRAVADLEAHRRETTRVEQFVLAARRTLEARQADASSSSPGTQRDAVLSFLEDRLAASDSPMVFLNTFAGVSEMVRISALDRLVDAAASRSFVYLTDDAATLAWAQDNLGESAPVEN